MSDYLDKQEYIQSQYSDSPTIKKLLDNFRGVILLDGDIDVFYENIMDLDTATGVGLDVWGNIVGVTRELQLEDGTFVTLEDDNFRQFIKFKALANISDASMATLNKMAQVLYNNDDLIITNILTPNSLDNGDYYNTTPMRVRWTWRANDVSDLERALFSQGIILCLAAGVDWTVGVISKDPLFGFKGSKLNPFNQGAFGVIANLGMGGST